MDPVLLAHATAAKGFMPLDEGAALFAWATDGLSRGPGLEVGTYCGKSAVHFGAAARVAGSTFFTVDHHRGSEENQAGWEHHDTEVVDPEFGLMDTLPFFRKTIARAGLEDEVIGIVGRSTTLSQHWRTPLGLLFIDGGHAEEPAQADYTGWAHWVAPGGLLLVHDVFENSDDGGQAPFHVFQRALASGSFVQIDSQGSLQVLRRVSGEAGDPVG